MRGRWNDDWLPDRSSPLSQAPTVDLGGTTAFLGTVFLGFQYYEFSSFVHEGLTITTNLFGSTFYTLTGFHGGHVAVGVLLLLTLLVRSFQGKLGPEKAMNVEITGLYWHFVDVVWIVIFTVVYLIQSG